MKITRQKARQLRAIIEQAATSFDDETALEAVELFPEWRIDTTYAAGVRIRYEDQLYRVVQAHTSQAEWTPDLTPALYTPVADPGTIPVWVQPTGVQDAYMIGDKVHYPTIDDPVYESVIDNNTWSPDAYPAGWSLVE